MRKLPFEASVVAGILGAIIVGLSGVGVAAASRPTPAVIQEHTLFAGAHEPPVGTFTVSGIPGCTSGSFSDELVSFNKTGARLVIDRTYVCDGGGTFTARVALHLSKIDAAGLQTADGSWRIVATTGGLASLAGSGSASGLNSSCEPAGTAFGVCALGESTVTASLQ